MQNAEIFLSQVPNKLKVTKREAVLTKINGLAQLNDKD